MKIILRQDYEKLGKMGEVVEVKPGFARNFLIPKNLAYVATKSNMQALEEEKRIYNLRVQKEIKNSQKLASDLEKVSITIPVKVGEEEKIFGSVTHQMIVDQLKEKGFEIDKRKIEIEEPIKTLGIYNVTVKLYTDISAKIKVWVVKE